MNRYRPLEPVDYTGALNIINCGTSEEKLLLPLRAGEYMNSWKDAQGICIRSFESEDPQIRANAALGLSYIARNTGCLENHLVKPLLIRELISNEQYRGRIIDAICDINLFMGWHIAEKVIAEYQSGATADL